MAIRPPITNDYTFISSMLTSSKSPVMSVSVVIPFWRGIEILAKTLWSLAHQDYPTDLYEVILSLDGCDEDLDFAIRQAQGIKLRTVSQPRRGFRPSSARNNGIRSARGEVILSLDFDIVCPVNCISAHMRWFRLRHRIATIGTRDFVDTADTSIGVLDNTVDWMSQLPKIKSISNNSLDMSDKRLSYIHDLRSHPFPANAFHGCNVAYLKQDAIAIGGWDEAYDGYLNYEDIDFGHRLWLSGVFLIYVSEAEVYHQENNVVSLEEKQRLSTRNRKLLERRFPDLAAFRRANVSKRIF